MIEPVGVVFAVAWAIWSFIRYKRKALKPIVVGAVVSILIIAPWQIRIFKELEYPFFIKSTAGMNLWIGNNEAATGTVYNEDGYPVFGVDMPIELHERLFTALTEEGRHKILQSEAISYIKAHPLTTLKRDLWKIKLLWVCDKNHPKDRHPLNQIPNTILLILGGCGLVMVFIRRRDLSAYAPAFALWISYTLIYSVIVVVARYRFPMVALLAIPAAVALVGFYEFILQKIR
ncbi:MAG: hypothetical protein GY771_11730, partial [bacterium]|nr:hypothetical protein [bacterium]